MTDGAVVSLWRYPVKSMMGEELNASDVTDHGLLGDRSLALVDTETGKVVSAKNPRKWPTMFDFRAVFTTPPVLGSPLPPVRVTLPDGVSVTSDDARFAELLTGALGRPVTLASAAPSAAEPRGVLARHRRARPPGDRDRRGDALHHVLRPRHHPCAHDGDDQPATRALPAGPIRGQALPAQHRRASRERRRRVRGEQVGGARTSDRRRRRARDHRPLPALRHDHTSARRSAQGQRDPAHSGTPQRSYTSACMQKCVAPGESSEATP